MELFCASVANKCQLFFKAKKFDDQEFSDNGMKVVAETDIELVSTLKNISRKVMLFPHGDNAAEGECIC